MSIHKKIILFILIGIPIVFAGDLLINAFGPVQILRLAGYKKVITVNCCPQWINDEEYYYLEVTNYNDHGTGPSFGLVPVPCSFFWGKISNADFLIYKVNINKPNEKKLVMKLTERVNFTLWGEKIRDDEILFRISDDKKKMALILQIPMGLMDYDYEGYFLSINGETLGKKAFTWKWRDSANVLDISFDLTKIALFEYPGIFTKGISSNQIFKSERYFKWISNNETIDYAIKGNMLDVYLGDTQGKNMQLIYESRYPSFENVIHSFWEAAISKDENTLFLSKIGIFEKKNEAWKMVKDLKDMDGVYYPAISPNGRKLVSVKEDSGNIAVFELKELLK